MLPTLEAFYGGAAGGGKSDALLMGALQYCDIPNYAALLLRKSYTDLALPGALMDRAMDWLSPHTDTKWNDKTKTWTFPSGASITFGYIDTEKDKYRYQSAEFQYIGFDELTQFPETQYRYLLSRLRRLKHSDIPLRVRSASNPGGIGHEWVKHRFVVATTPSGSTAKRPFIAARLEDNPHLDQEEYERSLSELDHLTRAQLRHGDWSAAVEGNLFKREWFPIVQDFPPGGTFARYWDLAATAPKRGTDPDYTVGVLGTYVDGVFYVCDVVRHQLTPQNVERIITQCASMDGVKTSIWIEQEAGASGKAIIEHYQRNVLPGYPVRGDRPSGPKQERAAPVSAAAEAGRIKLVSGQWIQDFLDELTVFGTDACAHDDQVDALSGCFSKLAIRPLATWDDFYNEEVDRERAAMH